MRLWLAMALAPLVSGQSYTCLPRPGDYRECTSYWRVVGVDVLAAFISIHEGWEAENSLPRILNNPGALRFAAQRAANPGPAGYARFPQPADGWEALWRDLIAKSRKRLTPRQILILWNGATYAPALPEFCSLQLDRPLVSRSPLPIPMGEIK